MRLAVARAPRISWNLGRGRDARSSITIVSVAFNNPLVIDTQARLLELYVKDQFRYVVVDNSSSKASARSIRTVCADRGVTYFRLPRNPYTGRDPSFSHGEALNFTMRNLPRIGDGVAIGLLDHDVFPTSEISILEILSQNAAYGRSQEMKAGWYLWPGLMFFRCDAFDLRLMDFRPIPGVGDTGARLAPLLQDDAKRVRITRTAVGSVEVDGRTESFELHDIWAHTLSASGWRGAGTERKALVEALREELDHR